MKRKVPEQEYRKKKLRYLEYWYFYNSRTGEWEKDLNGYGPGCYAVIDNNDKMWVKKYSRSSGFKYCKK
jgi:hypothetical protein